MYVYNRDLYSVNHALPGNYPEIYPAFPKLGFFFGRRDFEILMIWNNDYLGKHGDQTRVDIEGSWHLEEQIKPLELNLARETLRKHHKTVEHPSETNYLQVGKQNKHTQFSCYTLLGIRT